LADRANLDGKKCKCTMRHFREGLSRRRILAAAGDLLVRLAKEPVFAGATTQDDAADH
jgi:hypothetical protein